jgi:sRNA-binding carbon storage regulator CsrA
MWVLNEMGQGMLKLIRREQENIIIILPSGEEVIISVLEVMPRKVALGFVWPDESGVKIYRQEVLERIENESNN